MPLIKLAVPKAVAKTRIRNQIEEGQEIISRVLRDRPSAEKLLEDRKNWSGFTSEILRQSFTETEYSDDFVAEWDAAIMYGSGQTMQDQVTIAVSGGKAQLVMLRTIERKIELLQESSPINSAPEVSGVQISSSNGPQIFISHSSADRKAAESLADLFRAAMSIQAEKIRCTSALAYSLPFGVDSVETLRREVSTADVVIGLVTLSSVESHWVLFELGSRWGLGKPLLAVLARGADYGILPAPIRTNHALKVDPSESAQVVKLVEQVATLLNLKCAASWQYEKQTAEFITASSEPRTQAPVQRTGLTALDIFKQKYPYEETVSWKYDESGKRDGPFCPNCVDEGVERRLNPGATKGTYSCVVHKTSFRTAEYHPQRQDRPPRRGGPQGWMGN